MKRLILLIGLFGFLATSLRSPAQCNGWSSLQTVDSIYTNPAFGIATSPEIDKLGRAITYLATVSGGVKVYDNNASGNPTLVASIAISDLGNLDAINLYQDSIWLYVCLGNIWNSSNQMAGLAIIDVSNPSSPIVLDVYVHSGVVGGAGAVAIQGNYAYLAANQNGLVILDISNKSNIQFKSSLALNTNFPHTSVGNTAAYNARGIGLRGNHAFICFDRGGLRIVDISNVNAPVQINQYCYAPLINKATAYNNIAIFNQIAYVTIDYYGMEVLDISNPASITQLGWWHPTTWADTTNNYNQWANSKGHANEIEYDSTCQKVYIAAGKSDAVVIDVSNPAAPATCETYGSTTDAYGTWGLDFFDGKIALAYIWSVAFPPYSNYTGLKLLQTNCSTNGMVSNQNSVSEVTIFPNPTTDKISITCPNQKLESIQVMTWSGEVIDVYTSTEFSLNHLPKGLYFLLIQTNKSRFARKILKN